MERANAWKKYQEEDKRQAVYDFADGYRKFLSEHKTEREGAAFFEAEAKQAGFENLDEIIASGKTLKAGDNSYTTSPVLSVTLSTMCGVSTFPPFPIAATYLTTSMGVICVG